MRKNLDFLGYPLYEISDEGVVYSLNYRRGRKEHPMKPHKDTKGYYQVRLRNSEGKKMFIVHRLVAMAFIPNPLGYDQINHKDEVKTNNHVSNLEWCTCAYNMSYGTGNVRRSLSLKGVPKPTKQKRVEQLDLKGNHVAYFCSTREAGKETGATSISNACLGKAKTSGGYKWRYV